MNDRDDDAQLIAEYAKRVGERLRTIRRQQRMSLQDVEASTAQEFKASVLGAYERGERAISVLRLQRLARYYNVPVDQLLPSEDADGIASVIDITESAADEGPVAIDLTRLERLPSAEAALLGRYLRMIQVQRQDFNGRVLTIRGDDLRAIACMLDTPAEMVARRLDDLGLRFVRIS
jgi:transcriptional regulator with XRE-family HTH domain